MVRRALRDAANLDSFSVGRSNRGLMTWCGLNVERIETIGSWLYNDELNRKEKSSDKSMNC